jgi:hypothetical protein
MASRDRAYDLWHKNKFSVIVHHYLSDFFNKIRSAKNSCESSYGSYFNSKLTRCTSNKECWNALGGLGANQKPRPSVAHINPDELNDYFITIRSAVVAAQYDTDNAAASSGYEFKTKY